MFRINTTRWIKWENKPRTTLRCAQTRTLSLFSSLIIYVNVCAEEERQRETVWECVVSKANPTRFARSYIERPNQRLIYSFVRSCVRWQLSVFLSRACQIFLLSSSFLKTITVRKWSVSHSFLRSNRAARFRRRFSSTASLSQIYLSLHRYFLFFAHVRLWPEATVVRQWAKLFSK